MYILTLSEVLESKALIKNKFNMILHFHDSRGGQAFSSDESGESVKEFISAVFAAKNAKLFFSMTANNF